MFVKIEERQNPSFRENDSKTLCPVWLRAAELVEMGHCKGEIATREDGTPCSETDPAAARWCLVGAWGRASAELRAPSIYRAEAPYMKGQGYPTWNNAPERTAAEVAQFCREMAEGKW